MRVVVGIANVRMMGEIFLNKALDMCAKLGYLLHSYEYKIN
jgi:hypothetical protein